MENKKQVIGVRYCGGCNPRYDRVALINKFKELFPEADFTGIDPGVRYDAVLIACGCQSKCADISGITVAPGKLFHLAGWEDLLPVKGALIKALEDSGTVLSLDNDQVRELMPHKGTALMIDSVTSLIPGEEAECTFTPRAQMEIFKGHFPGHPILPGVYTLEAIAQAGGALALSMDRYKGRIPVFTGVSEASFRHPVGPDECLNIRVSLVKENRKTGMLEFKGQAHLDKDLVCECGFRLLMKEL